MNEYLTKSLILEATCIKVKNNVKIAKYLGPLIVGFVYNICVCNL